LKTPAGSPASCSALARWVTDIGVSSAGLITTEFPLIRAGAVFQAGMAIGKFHGVMRPTTPSGSRLVRTVVSASALSKVNPVADQPAAPKNWNTPIARPT